MIRRATPEDVPTITGLIYDLAEYEKARHECTVVPEQIHEALFGPQPSVYAHVAEESGEDGTEGRVVGVALWFRNFSTWDGVHGIYLEDLFVRPEHRGKGHGRALLAALAHECVERGYTRLSWSVLDWNEPSIGFYRSLGAVAQDEWTTFRLSGPALQALGS
ncbi:MULTISPECIES: GNAT family N-acetyltransferase [Rhodococcus]|uniref:GNAT family N-acetyltransferase n=1 Tax=Rhodococcus sp. D-6 TaxID=1387842 RepID=A0AAU7V3A0_9NOCA|nr:MULTISPECIES: GNAT family N-acetyltransferase [Rhodococcus]AOD23883.1 GNAT family N-acetyltransferase [Rhodococcus sp. p52]AWZ25867.1 N-acetyltransferase [Rhodococcus pyridinivorans]MCD2118157.1 GNAT family N-acetyltransferase [Rhodococcus pyridinivorans]MCZ4627018.1 GNAT family N-acetyltransferase [Rhodococcus pyridinivorans]MCZ4648239.1 GNAT family N-acetyltransferase [Rhodococcus pyridinivorans]